MPPCPSAASCLPCGPDGPSSCDPPPRGAQHTCFPSHSHAPLAQRGAATATVPARVAMACTGEPSPGADVACRYSARFWLWTAGMYAFTFCTGDADDAVTHSFDAWALQPTIVPSRLAPFCQHKILCGAARTAGHICIEAEPALGCWPRRSPEVEGGQPSRGREQVLRRRQRWAHRAARGRGRFRAAAPGLGLRR